MADIQDEILSYFSDPLGSPDEAKEAGYLQGLEERKLKGEAGVKRARDEYNRIASYAEAVGEEPPPVVQEGMFTRILDTLDTPRQWIAGGIGSLTGHKGYEDLSLLEGAAKGADQDLTTGALLRDATIPILDIKLKDHDVLRGAASFIGDVLTDPLSYIAPLGKAAAKVGGLSLTTNKIGKAAEDGSAIFKRLTDAKEKELLAEAAQIYGVAADDLPKDIRSTYALMAKQSAAVPFKALGALRQDVRAKSVGKGFEELGTAFDDELAGKAKDIVGMMGIELPEGVGTKDIYDVLDSVVKKPSIMLSGPFAGAGSVLGRIPLISDEARNIPGVTKASEFLYSKLGDAYYGLPVKIQNAVTTGLKNDPDSLLWKSLDAAGSALKGMGHLTFGAGKLLSKRALAGGGLFESSVSKSAINEHVRARAMLGALSLKESDLLLQDLGDVADKDSIFSSIIDFTESYSQEARKLDELVQRRQLKIDPQALLQQKEALWLKSLDGLRTKHNGITPGSGDKAVASMEKVQVLFESLAAKEKAAGILDRAIDGYIHRSYLGPQALELVDSSPEVRAKVRDLLVGDDPSNFTLKRTFDSIQQAEALGYRAERNLKNIVAGRLFAHKQAMAEKEFAERFIYFRSLTPEARKKLNALAVSNVAAVRKRALSIFNDLDTSASTKEGLLERGVMLVDNERDAAKRPVTTEVYERWREVATRIAQNPTAIQPGDAESLEAIKRFGLTFSPDEAQKIARNEQLYSDIISALPGRAGESQFARSGATTLEEVLGRKVKGSKDEFWDGLVPQGFAEAYKDSLQGRDLLKSVAERLRRHRSKDPFNETLYKAASLFQGYSTIMKAALTLPFPAYWARNLASAQISPLEATSVLGEALNPYKMYQYHKVLRDPSYHFVTKTGEKITGDILRAELLAAGFSTSQTMTGEFLSAYNEMFDSSADLLGRKIPGLGKALSEREATAKLGRAKRYAKAGVNFGQRLETFGRSFTYMNMRMKGMDPGSASAEANRLLVDYQMGKTGFEASVMNPLFFFYAFSRGNISNQITSLIRRPGALTNKLAAFNGVAEMLTDPENYEMNELLEEELKSTRSNMQLSQYLGTNPETGLPRILQGAGLDMEDAARFTSIIDPFTKMGGPNTWNEAVTAAGDATSSAMKVALSQMNPLVKGALEVFGFKQSLYFDRPITDDTLRKIPLWERDLPKILHALPGAVGGAANMVLPFDVWEGLDTVTKGVLGGKKNSDGTMTINPYMMAVLVNLVPGASRFYATRSQLTAPGVTGGDKMMRFLTGAKVMEIDPEKSLAYTQNRKIKEWAEMRDFPTTANELNEDLSLMDEEEDGTN